MKPISLDRLLDLCARASFSNALYWNSFSKDHDKSIRQLNRYQRRYELFQAAKKRYEQQQIDRLFILNHPIVFPSSNTGSNG